MLGVLRAVVVRRTLTINTYITRPLQRFNMTDTANTAEANTATSSTEPVKEPQPQQPERIKTGGTSAHAAGKKKEKKEKDDDSKPEQRKRPGMIVLEPVKGTRDFAPDDMRVRYATLCFVMRTHSIQQLVIWKVATNCPPVCFSRI